MLQVATKMVTFATKNFIFATTNENTLAFMWLRKLGLETFILRSGSSFDLEKFSIKKMFEDMYLNTLYKASRGLRLRNTVKGLIEPEMTLVLTL